MLQQATYIQTEVSCEPKNREKVIIPFMFPSFWAIAGLKWEEFLMSSKSLIDTSVSAR